MLIEYDEEMGCELGELGVITDQQVVTRPRFSSVARQRRLLHRREKPSIVTNWEVRD